MTTSVKWPSPSLCKKQPLKLLLFFWWLWVSSSWCNWDSTTWALFFCYIHQYFWRPMGLTWPLQWNPWMFDIITCNSQVFNLAFKILADTFRHSFILSALGSSVWFHFSLVKLKIISLIFLLPHNLWGEILGMCQRFFLPWPNSTYDIYFPTHIFWGKRQSSNQKRVINTTLTLAAP